MKKWRVAQVGEVDKTKSFPAIKSRQNSSALVVLACHICIAKSLNFSRGDPVLHSARLLVEEAKEHAIVEGVINLYEHVVFATGHVQHDALIQGFSKGKPVRHNSSMVVLHSAAGAVVERGVDFRKLVNDTDQFTFSSFLFARTFALDEECS